MGTWLNPIDRSITTKYRVGLELVSKELNHYGGIALFFQDWAPGTLTGGE